MPDKQPEKLPDFSSTSNFMMLEMLKGQNDDIEVLKQQMRDLEAQLRANTESGKEIVEVFQSLKGFLQVMKTMERVVIFISKMAAFCTLVWVGFKAAVHYTKDGGG
ncbi:MAG: hypothetical protein AB7F19_07455 [Candidatus Babeliales bacterium]